MNLLSQLKEVIVNQIQPKDGNAIRTIIRTTINITILNQNMSNHIIEIRTLRHKIIAVFPNHFTSPQI